MKKIDIKIWSPKSCRHNEQFRVNNWSAKLKVEQTQYNQKEQQQKRTVIKFIIIDRSSKNTNSKLFNSHTTNGNKTPLTNNVIKISGVFFSVKQKPAKVYGTKTTFDI